ncbi:DUF368 domain-containing protein [Cytobacillus horneckiae]|uniref:DUF368 domain-containing protein n=1 Tax=Cytobacillus horneckiae TaxID=549687 RepID=UPI003D9A9680
MHWKNIIKGTAMGTVETVPGVSSSTIAMLLGIYEKLIEAINALTTKEWKKGLMFLIPVVFGIGIGFLLSIRVVDYFLTWYPIQTHYFFIGLIIGMLPFIWKSGLEGLSKETYGASQFIIMLIFFALVSSLNFLPDKEAVMTNLTAFDYVFLFFSGWLASTALVLPGISGAMILMILGTYKTATNAIMDLNIPVILVVGLGIVCGILITGKLVRYMLHTHHDTTYSIMLGLIAGSLVVLYPGLPVHIGTLFICIILVIAGFLLSTLISRRGNS